MVLASCFSSAASTSSFDQFRGQGVTDSIAFFGCSGAQRDKEVGFAGARITDQAERFAFAYPVRRGEGVPVPIDKLSMSISTNAAQFGGGARLSTGHHSDVDAGPIAAAVDVAFGPMFGDRSFHHAGAGSVAAWW
jgi:hypothetical protein